MNEMISGIAGRALQQMSENPASKLNKPSPTRSFENVLSQQDGTTQAPRTQETDAGKTEVSETDRRQILDQLEKDLSTRFQLPDPNQTTNFKKVVEEFLGDNSRLGMLNDMRAKMGSTAKVTDDLSGRFIQVENEYKAVESIMNSNKNLSTGELLALQSRLYQVGQHIEVMSKVVDQMAGGIKTVLNTNV